MASQTRDLISIIMPAHNAEAYIGEAIESVLNQTEPCWELLVIDDASTDGTADGVAQYGDTRIQYHRVARLGSPAAVRNVGLRLAQGAYIAFLDADDCYLPEALATLRSALEAEPSATAVYGFAIYQDAEGQPAPQGWILDVDEQGQHRLPKGYTHTWEKILRGDFSHLLSSLMLRRQTYQRVGLLNPALYAAEDYEYYVRLFLDCFAGVRCIPHYIYRYRLHAQSLTKTPEYYQRVVESGLIATAFPFDQASLPPSAQGLQSIAFTETYRYFARERLLQGQNGLALHILRQAQGDFRVNRLHWFQYCFPLVLRSLLPRRLNQALVALRCFWKQGPAPSVPMSLKQ